MAILMAVVSLMAGRVALAAAVPATVALDELARPGDWRATGAHVRPARSLRINDRPTLHARVPLREGAVGVADWPKLWHPLSPALGADWRAFDRLEFFIMARLSPPRNAPVRSIAIQLLCPDREHAATVSVMFDELDTWQRVSIPLADLPSLERLEAMQLYFARRRYAGVDLAEFYIGGFQLVRDAGPVANEAVLLTPLPRLNKSRVIIESTADAGVGDDSIPLRLHGGGATHTLLPRRTTEPGQFEADLTALQLPPGRYWLVMHPDQPDRRREAVFHWLPFDVEQASLGEGLIGDNRAEARIRSTSPEAESVELAVRLADRLLVTHQVTLAPDTTTAAAITWPLREKQQGQVQFQVYWKGQYLGGIEQSVEAPSVLGQTTQPRPLIFEPGKSVTFRVPVALAAGSRDDAVLHWELYGDDGLVHQQGQSPITGATARLRLNPLERKDAGRYGLHIILRWASQELTATLPLLLVEGPFAQ